MSKTYHAVVWLDHREARVFHFDRETAETLVIHPDQPKQHLHHKANAVGSGNAAEDKNYFDHVAAAVADAEKILITGPSMAKTQLVKHIHKYEPRLIEHIAGIETIDHPSDKQLVAHARAYFKDDHMQPPRGA